MWADIDLLCATLAPSAVVPVYNETAIRTRPPGAAITTCFVTFSLVTKNFYSFINDDEVYCSMYMGVESFVNVTM